MAATLQGHEDNAWKVHWSPDGTRITSASRDGAIRLWECPGTRTERAWRQPAGTGPYASGNPPTATSTPCYGGPAPGSSAR
ncbi:MAG: hypothetical protein QOF44_5978 [Streptomyces sp.]|nr:hypothetical protein [Streptomyces sp.]